MYPTKVAQFDALLGFPILIPITHSVNTAVTTTPSKGVFSPKTWHLEPGILMAMLQVSVEQQSEHWCSTAESV